MQGYGRFKAAGVAQRKYNKAQKGDAPEWLPLALTLLRDGGNCISDRGARRVGVSHTLLVRHPTYRRAGECVSHGSAGGDRAARTIHAGLNVNY
jgi:hypothetical protein